MKSISVHALQEKIQSEGDTLCLVDVREPIEFQGEAIPGAENIPQDTIENEISTLKKCSTVYVHCRTGGRSSRACAHLEAAGIEVVNVDGGIEAWKAAGFETVSQKKTIPLMRQVMIVAGSLILLGAVLGHVSNYMWFLLPVAVGAGLLFAGLTGICSMTKILTYMPWNK